MFPPLSVLDGVNALCGWLPKAGKAALEFPFSALTADPAAWNPPQLCGRWDPLQACGDGARCLVLGQHLEMASNSLTGIHLASIPLMGSFFKAW